MVSSETLKDLALEAGFDLVGFTSPPTGEETFEYNLLIDDGEVKDIGEHDSSSWKGPLDIPHETRTIVVLGFNHYQEAPKEPPGDNQAVLARYMTGACMALATRLRKFYRSLSILGIRSLGHLDPTELALRWLACRAGLGWIGKNTMILTEEFGSWVTWSAVFLAQELPPDSPSDYAGCLDCDECLRACPTFALYEPYKLDRTKCLTFISETLSSPDAAWPIRNAKQAFGRRILGCDICQEVCPQNRHAQKPGSPDIASLPLHVDINELLGKDEDSYDSRYRLLLWGIPRNRVETMVRIML